jgi:hypothetical protein
MPDMVMAMQQQPQDYSFLGNMAFHVSTSSKGAASRASKGAARVCSMLRANSLAQLRVSLDPAAGPIISLHLQDRHCLLRQQLQPGKAALQLLPPQLTSSSWILLLPGRAAIQHKVCSISCLHGQAMQHACMLSQLAPLLLLTAQPTHSIRSTFEQSAIKSSTQCLASVTCALFMLKHAAAVAGVHRVLLQVLQRQRWQGVLQLAAGGLTCMIVLHSTC